MKKTILLLLSLAACLITYADQRGVSFEKDGLIYTIASEFGRKTEDTARYQVMGIGERAFENAMLKDLIIPYGLKFIGKEAFKNMELTSGVLVVPQAKRMGANLFDGMKTNVFITGLEDSYEGKTNQIFFYKTFENTDKLPNIYIPHSSIGTQVNNVDKKIFYTVGNNIIDKWMTGRIKKKKKHKTKVNRFFRKTTSI